MSVKTSYTLPGGLNYDLADWMDAVHNIWSLSLLVLGPLATVALVWSVIKMISGDDKEIAKAIKHIKYIFFAIVVIYFIPTVVNFGTEIGSRYAWNPDKYLSEEAQESFAQKQINTAEERIKFFKDLDDATPDAEEEEEGKTGH